MRYGFQEAIGAFFLADADELARLLPHTLTPQTARPRHGVLAITAFDFDESVVGAYGELVISVLVPPFAPASAELPQAAIFPIALCTTTEASRLHAEERYYLPAQDRCMDMRFERNDGVRKVLVSDAGAPVLELRVGRTRAVPSTRLYQCFSSHEERLYRADLWFEGVLDEHEEEMGALVLEDHPIANRIAGAISDHIPLREQSMDQGEERYGTPTPHQPF
jgi:hypothetical protein